MTNTVAIAKILEYIDGLKLRVKELEDEVPQCLRLANYYVLQEKVLKLEEMLTKATEWCVTQELFRQKLNERTKILEEWKDSKSGMNFYDLMFKALQDRLKVLEEWHKQVGEGDVQFHELRLRSLEEWRKECQPKS